MTTVKTSDLEMTTLDDRERWLALFAVAAFGSSERRMWVWQPLEPGPLPETVAVDASVPLWEPVVPLRERTLRPLRERVVDRLRQRKRVAVEGVRLRAQRLRSS